MSLTAVVLSLGLSLTPQQTPPDLSWMSGYWLDCADGREASETWSDPRMGLMAGHAVSVENGRVSFEVSTIRPTAQGLAYMAQPGGAPPTAFVLSDSGPSHAVFSNLENDFPHHIRYERDGDVLKARIEGPWAARRGAWNGRSQHNR